MKTQSETLSEENDWTRGAMKRQLWGIQCVTRTRIKRDKRGPGPWWRMRRRNKAKMAEMQHFGCSLSLYHKEEENDDTFITFHNNRNKHISYQPRALFCLRAVIITTVQHDCNPLFKNVCTSNKDWSCSQQNWNKIWLYANIFGLTVCWTAAPHPRRSQHTKRNERSLSHPGKSMMQTLFCLFKRKSAESQTPRRQQTVPWLHCKGRKEAKCTGGEALCCGYLVPLVPLIPRFEHQLSVSVPALVQTLQLLHVDPLVQSVFQAPLGGLMLPRTAAVVSVSVSWHGGAPETWALVVAKGGRPTTIL